MATLATILSAYENNADYDATGGSVSKAEAFRTACRQLLAKQPSKSAQGDRGSQLEYDVTLIAEQLKQVQQWLAIHGASSDDDPGVLYADFDNFRDE